MQETREQSEADERSGNERTGGQTSFLLSDSSAGDSVPGVSFSLQDTADTALKTAVVHDYAQQYNAQCLELV